MLRGTISIPRLQTELRTEALVNYSPTKGYLQISSAATSHGNSVSERVLLRYGRGKKHDPHVQPINLNILLHYFIVYP